MKIKNKLYLLTTFITLLIVIPPSAASEGRISSEFFGDVYYFAKSGNNDLKNQNGFVFRRIHFTYVNDFAENFSAMLRTEFSNKDFKSTTASKVNPTLKDAYLNWNPNSSKVYFGITATPTFSTVETHWGYRSVEKSPLDLWGFGSPRDFGIALKRKAFDGLIKYNVMVGNGASNKNETDRRKKGYLSVQFKPVGSLMVEGYADIADQGQYVTYGFLGFSQKPLRLGAVYAYKSSGGVSLISLYSTYGISDSLSTYARWDFLTEPMTDSITYLQQSTTHKPQILIAGLDFQLAKNIHLLPNAEVILYRGSGAPTSDIISRITFHWKL